MFPSMLKVLVLVQALEDGILQQQNLPKEDCDLMEVSPTGTNQGKAILFSI